LLRLASKTAGNKQWESKPENTQQGLSKPLLMFYKMSHVEMDEKG